MSWGAKEQQWSGQFGIDLLYTELMLLVSSSPHGTDETWRVLAALAAAFRETTWRHLLVWGLLLMSIPTYKTSAPVISQFACRMLGMLSSGVELLQFLLPFIWGSCSASLSTIIHLTRPSALIFPAVKWELQLDGTGLQAVVQQAFAKGLFRMEFVKVLSNSASPDCKFECFSGSLLELADATPVWSSSTAKKHISR